MGKIIDIQCQSCKPISDNCPSCGNDSGGVIAQGVRLIDDAGESHYVPLGYTATWDLHGATITSNGMNYRINYEDTTYSNVRDLVSAICDCSATGSGGGTGSVASLTNNGNGSFTFNDGNGGAPVTIDVYENAGETLLVAPLTVSGTVYPIGTSVQTVLAALAAQPSHPSAGFTNFAAPFSWNIVTQTGNVPVSPTFVDNGDGTVTFNAGDGSADVVIEVTEDASDVLTTAPITIGGTLYQTGTDIQTVVNALVANAHPAASLDAISNPALTVDGTTQVISLDLDAAGSYDNTTSGLVSDSVQDAIDEIAWTIATSGHAAASITNTAAPFSWNTASQVGNIPLAPTMVDNGNGTVTFNSGDGSAPVTIDIYENAGESVTVADLTIGGTLYPAGTTVQAILDALTDTAHVAATVGATSNVALTIDPVTQVAILDLDAAGSYDNTATTLTSTSVQDAITELATDSHPSATFTNNVAAFAWDDTTQVGNIPPTPTLVDNGDGTITYNPNDGSAPVTVDVTEDASEVLTTTPVTIGATTYPIGTDVQTILADLAANAHVAATVDATSNPALTIDATTQVAKLDLDAVGSYDNTATTLASTSVQDAITELAANSHVPATITNNVAPFSFVSATQTANIPIPTLTQTGATEYTFSQNDGVTPDVVIAGLPPITAIFDDDAQAATGGYPFAYWCGIGHLTGTYLSLKLIA